MRSRKNGDGHIVILERGDQLIESLTAFAQAEKITHASFQGIGALDAVTIGYYELPAKQYRFQTFPETLEVASMQGNIALVDGAPFIHVHAVLSRCDESLGCIGGHIKDARVAVTLEIHIRLGGSDIVRLPDDTIGLKLITL